MVGTLKPFITLATRRVQPFVLSGMGTTSLVVTLAFRGKVNNSIILYSFRTTRMKKNGFDTRKKNWNSFNDIFGKIMAFFFFTGFIFFFICLFVFWRSAQVHESVDVRHLSKANPKGEKFQSRCPMGLPVWKVTYTLHRVGIKASLVALHEWKRSDLEGRKESSVIILRGVLKVACPCSNLRHTLSSK